MGTGEENGNCFLHHITALNHRGKIKNTALNHRGKIKNTLKKMGYI